MSDDPRYVAMKAGIGQLKSHQIQTILDTPDESILFDGGNYCDGKYCPLAIALNVPNALEWSEYAPTNSVVDRFIGSIGLTLFGPTFVYNQMHSIPGEFYRDDRPGDLRRVCREILAERSTTGS